MTSPGLVIAGRRAGSGAAEAGGRPRGRIGPARPGSRPASASARRSRNSIWAFVLRSSSLAYLARASWTAGSSRSRTLLCSVTAVPWLPSLVEGAGVDDRLGGLLAAQHHEQVRDHRGLALLIQLDDVLVLEPLQRQMDHADRAFHDPLPGADPPRWQPGEPGNGDINPGYAERRTRTRRSQARQSPGDRFVPSSGGGWRMTWISASAVDRAASRAARGSRVRV
jgi:hypothetical protein